MALKLIVDPIKCDAYGHCAELAPELLILDEWGYPVVTRVASDDEGDLVEVVVRSCPRRAVSVVVEGPTRRSRGR